MNTGYRSDDGSMGNLTQSVDPLPDTWYARHQAATGPQRPLAVMRPVNLSGDSWTRPKQEVTMERTDWLDAGFNPDQARFLMVTAITHHSFDSRTWSESEVRKLFAELAEIDATGGGAPS
jgi:hypothetical protein